MKKANETYFFSKSIFEIRFYFSLSKWVVCLNITLFPQNKLLRNFIQSAFLNFPFGGRDTLSSILLGSLSQSSSQTDIRLINKREMTTFSHICKYGNLTCKRIREPTYLRDSETDRENETCDILSYEWGTLGPQRGERSFAGPQEGRCSVIRNKVCPVGRS